MNCFLFPVKTDLAKNLSHITVFSYNDLVSASKKYICKHDSKVDVEKETVGISGFKRVYWETIQIVKGCELSPHFTPLKKLPTHFQSKLKKRKAN